MPSECFVFLLIVREDCLEYWRQAVLKLAEFFQTAHYLNPKDARVKYETHDVIPTHMLSHIQGTYTIDTTALIYNTSFPSSQHLGPPNRRLIR